MVYVQYHSHRGVQMKKSNQKLHIFALCNQLSSHLKKILQNVAAGGNHHWNKDLADQVVLDPDLKGKKLWWTRFKKAELVLQVWGGCVALWSMIFSLFFQSVQSTLDVCVRLYVRSICSHDKYAITAMDPRCLCSLIHCKRRDL